LKFVEKLFNQILKEILKTYS